MPIHIDYSEIDFATTGDTWDIIIDTTGTVPFARCDRSLRAGGRLVAIQASFAQTLGIGKPSKASGKEVIAGYVPARAEDLRYIAKLASQGVLKPVVDRIYPLEQAVKAHAYVDTGRKRGSVVLTVAASPRKILHSRMDGTLAVAPARSTLASFSTVNA